MEYGHMITLTIKVSSQYNIRTFFFTFSWELRGRPVHASGHGILFYVLWVMYLEHISDPETAAMCQGASQGRDIQ